MITAKQKKRTNNNANNQDNMQPEKQDQANQEYFQSMAN